MRYDYDMIALGGGAAGLGVAAISANLGVKACLVESHRLGGDCTWTGCIPSKTLIHASKVVHWIRKARAFGLTDADSEIDFAKVIGHVDTIRQEVYTDADSTELFRAKGVDVFSGKGRFVDAHTIEISLENGTIRRITGRYICICTGSEPAVPMIPGLSTVPFLTSESLFEIASLPKRLIVIGAGPIGIEMAQAFRRLGSEVAVVDVSDRILPRDNRELADLLGGFLRDEGIRFLLNTRIEELRQLPDGAIRMTVQENQSTRTLDADHILVATGRQPRVEGIGLDTIGLRYTDTGIRTNANCRTNIPHIFAAGDVLGWAPFTHMAEHAAKVVMSNAILKVPTRVDRKHIPWTTFTDPEIAHVGASEAELRTSGKRFETYRFPYKKIDRALTDGDSRGWIKVYATKSRGMILGVDILGAHAGDLIGEFALAMKNRISLRRMSDTIHPYPTYALGARRAADQYYVRKLAAWQIKLLKRIFRYQGQIPDLSDRERIV